MNKIELFVLNRCLNAIKKKEFLRDFEKPGVGGRGRDSMKWTWLFSDSSHINSSSANGRVFYCSEILIKTPESSCTKHSDRAIVFI